MKKSGYIVTVTNGFAMVYLSTTSTWWAGGWNYDDYLNQHFDTMGSYFWTAVSIICIINLLLLFERILKCFPNNRIPENNRGENN